MVEAAFVTSGVSKDRKLRCLFCKADSSASRSREHIVPESLGNTEHVLEPGIVCDRCNNYFARNVEEPILKATLNKPSKISAQTWMTQFFGLLCLSRGPFGQFAGR